MATAAEKLRALFEDDYLYEIMDNPEFGSQSGEHDLMLNCDNKLQDVSPNAYAARAQHGKEVIISVKSFVQSHAGELSSHDLWLVNVFVKQHEDLIEALEHAKMFLIPINGIGAGCPTYSFIETIEWMRFESLEDYQLYLDRLRACPRQIDQFIDSFEEGIKQNIVASLPMTRNVVDHLQGHIDGGLPELFDPLKQAAAEAIPSSMRQDITEAIEGVRQSFIKFRDFFVSVYFTHVRPDAGCDTLPNGKRIYEICLKYHTTTDLTPDQVHQIGLDEVARIQERYRNEVLIPLGFNPDDLSSFLDNMKTDRQFYVETSDDLLNVYRKTCSDIEQVMPKYFKEFPASPLEIRSREGGPAAYYIAGTADGKRPGRFYINTTHIDQKGTYESVALSLHEAIPGHHHQLALNIENKNIPKFLRFLEDRRYEVCPCRRNMCTAYCEGWGLYSEFLGEEMGLYKTPYDLFGRLSMEMMRAVRLVVDTGLHSKGWSIEESVQYMMKMTGKHRPEVEGEIYRYASWPGQACAYKIGEIEIRRLRKKAEDALGGKFDVKEFHSICLMNGPMSLILLGELVDKYIAENS
jgi:uncharacterized protein (DUF885 family)